VSEPQHTLAQEAIVEGVGLFLGLPARVRLMPAEPNTGVVFVRADLPGAPRVEARAANVPPAQRWTALQKGGAEIQMVEHVLSALAGLGVDNVVIECNAAEMPCGDGSAQTWVAPILKAGLREQNVPRRRLRVERPVVITDKDVALTAAPLPEGLLITYVLDYGRMFVKSQTHTVLLDRETFIREIAPARTYVLRPEVDAFIKMGMGRGATPENTVVLEPDGSCSVPLRFPDECARHKVLDMIGDLSLAGAPLCGRFVGYKSGHGTNVRLARALAEGAQGEPHAQG